MDGGARDNSIQLDNERLSSMLDELLSSYRSRLSSSSAMGGGIIGGEDAKGG